MDLTVGYRYRLLSFDRACHLAFRSQLLAMGFTPGIEFEVVRRGPFNGPLVIEVRGYKVSLRAEDLNFLKWECLNG